MEILLYILMSEGSPAHLLPDGILKLNQGCIRILEKEALPLTDTHGLCLPGAHGCQHGCGC